MATASKNKGADAPKAKYLVVSRLVQGVLQGNTSVETTYEAGEHIELTEAEAEPMLGHTVKPLVQG